MPTDIELQTLIMSETNASQYSDELNANIPMWWELFISKGQFLCYLYTKEKTLQFLLAKYRGLVDVVQGSDEAQLSQRFENAQVMLADVKKDIQRENPAAGVSESTVVNTIPDVTCFYPPGYPYLIKRGKGRNVI